MKERFLKDLGIYGISTLLVRLINFLLIPVYARVLSQDEYGAMDLINTLTFVTGVFLFLEMYQAVSRYFAEASDDQRKKIVATGLAHYLILMLPLLGVVWLVKDHLAMWLIGRSDAGNMVLLAFGAAMAMAVFNYLQTVRRFALQSSAYALASIACVLTTVLASIVLVVYAKQGLSGVFLGQLVGAAMGLVVSMQGNYKAYRVSMDWKMWKELIRFSAPLTVSAVLLYLMNYIDRWLIRDQLGLAAVGIYAVVFRIAAVPMLVMNIVSNSLLPHIYREYKDPQKVVEIGRLYYLIWSAGLLMVAWMAWLSPEIMLWMAGQAYNKYAYLFPVVLLSGFLLHYSYIFVGLYLGHKTHLTAYLYLAGLAAVYLLNTILLPLYGLAGTAISSILTTGGILVFQYFASQKAFSFPIQLRSMLVNGCLTIVPILIAFYLGYHQKFPDFVFRLVIGVVTSLAILYPLRTELSLVWKQLRPL